MKSTIQASRATSFAILTISMTVLVAALGSLLYVLLVSSKQASGEVQAYLMKLAYLDGAALVLAVVILLGGVIRYITGRLLAQPDKPTSTPYESAWTEAGKRLKPEDAPPIEPFEKKK